MAEDLKKSLIAQTEEAIRKGLVSDADAQTLIAKIELADPRLLGIVAKKLAEIKSIPAEAKGK